MGQVTVQKNSSAIIDLVADFSDNGWRISGGIATHGGCNAGYITLKLGTIPDGEYEISYEVLNRTSGTVRVVSGGVNGTSRNADGVYSDIIEITGSEVKFFSDGALSLKYVSIDPQDEEDRSLTLAFNENMNKWVTYYSYVPELMCKFGNNFFSFKAGELWKHNINEIRNNFYGVQYKSKITFYVNLSPSAIKQFHNIRVKSNKAWSAPNKGDLYIRPTEGKSQGLSSRLKKNRFKNLKGDWFADILRNMDDPRFDEELTALMKGGAMIGSVMKVTIENDDTVQVRLLEVDVTVSEHNFTY